MPENEYVSGYLPDIRDEYDDRELAAQHYQSVAAENARLDKLAGYGVAVDDPPDEKESDARDFLREQAVWQQRAGYQETHSEGYEREDVRDYAIAWSAAKEKVDADPAFHENVAGLVEMMRQLGNAGEDDIAIWKELRLGVAAHEALGYGDETRDDAALTDIAAREILKDLVPDPNDSAALADLFEGYPEDQIVTLAEEYREEWDRVHEALTEYLKGRYGRQMEDLQDGLEMANFIQALNNFDDQGNREWLGRALTHRNGYTAAQAEAELLAAITPEGTGHAAADRNPSGARPE